MRLVLDAPAGSPAAPALVPDEAPPVAEPGGVVVRMRWGGLNRIDRMLCDGRVPRPAGVHVLGGQGCGYVAHTGLGVEDLRPGQLVSLYPYGGCGACERCLAGNETLCRQARLDGVNAPGMFQACFPALARDAVVVPPGVGSELAALGSAVAVAWHVLVCRGGLRSGETVAISSISSGLGACCGALAALLGARVVGVARRRTLERLSVHPAWLAQTWESDGPPGARYRPRVDLAVDAVGAPTLPVLHAMLKTNGRIVTVGAHAGDQWLLNVWRFFSMEQDLRGSHGCHREDMHRAVEALGDLDEEGLIDSTFSLADHESAYERLDTPGRLGNVLVDLT